MVRAHAVGSPVGYLHDARNDIECRLGTVVASINLVMRSPVTRRGVPGNLRLPTETAINLEPPGGSYYSRTPRTPR